MYKSHQEPAGCQALSSELQATPRELSFSHEKQEPVCAQELEQRGQRSAWKVLNLISQGPEMPPGVVAGINVHLGTEMTRVGRTGRNPIPHA